MDNQNDQSQKQLSALEDEDLENITGGLGSCFGCFGAPKTTDVPSIGGAPRPLTAAAPPSPTPTPLSSPPASPARKDFLSPGPAGQLARNVSVKPDYPGKYK